MFGRALSWLRRKLRRRSFCSNDLNIEETEEWTIDEIVLVLQPPESEEESEKEEPEKEEELPNYNEALADKWRRMMLV